MSQEQRSLLAGVLSLLVFFLWYQFYAKKMMPTTPPQDLSKSTAAPSFPQGQFAQGVGQSPGANQAGGQGLEGNLPEGNLLKGEERMVTLQNDLFEVNFSSYGGKIKGLLLKKFHTTPSPKSPLVNLLAQEGDRIGTVVCDRCNFSIPDNSNYRLVSTEKKNEVVFETEQDGVVLRKSYQWDEDNYLLSMKISIHNQGARDLEGFLGLESLSEQREPDKTGVLAFLKQSIHKKDFVYQVGGKVERFGHKEGEQGSQGGITWAGIEDQYFLMALISRRVSSDQGLHLSRKGDFFSLSYFPSHLVIPPGGGHEEELLLYLGPKDRKYLEAAHVGLENAVDYGWFGLVAIPIARLLTLFHGWFKNWGLAIILLTLLVKILMNPLSIKSMHQMKEMQKIQPELQRLKEKYKDDRQRLNAETMQLFKLHKVNPMGGCLPMVLQMPIYIALYKVLYNSIELYHAPFVGFYRDLSAPDPYFILPVLLGVAMVLQQKMTPQTSVDPTQRQMMMIMPVMFTAFMLFLPVGLVLYIFVNTGMTVVQQYMHQKDVRWRDLGKIFSH